MLTSLKGNVNTVYPRLIHEILHYGDTVASRNGVTLELHPCVLEIENPLDRLVTSWNRPVNVAFALAEVLWILAGRRDVEMLKFYNKRIDTWSDDGATFNAPYGYRLREAHGHDQIEDAVMALKNDPGSRQVVLNVWHPPSDRSYDHNKHISSEPEWIPHKTADRACNMLSHLMIRNGKLDWMHIVRSNDAIWGVPYNFMQWMHLQEYIAARVGVPVGNFYHMVDSMHIYGAMEPNPSDPEAPDVARWDEARNIKEFNLYEMTGCHHAPMGETTSDVLSTVLSLEEKIRLNGIDGVVAFRNYVGGFDTGTYWKDVLDILLAHYLYLEGKDQESFRLLEETPDRVLALAQMRFYFSMRWHKYEILVRHVKSRYSLSNWILSEL